MVEQTLYTPRHPGLQNTTLEQVTTDGWTWWVGWLWVVGWRVGWFGGGWVGWVLVCWWVHRLDRG
jgi:hypothetical protein